MDNYSQKKCGFCGENIPADANRCPFCGSILEVEVNAQYVMDEQRNFVQSDNGSGTGDSVQANDVHDNSPIQPQEEQSGSVAADQDDMTVTQSDAPSPQQYGPTPPQYGSMPPQYGSTPPQYGPSQQGMGQVPGYGHRPEFGPRPYYPRQQQPPVYRSTGSRKPMSNGLKVFLTMLFALLPGIGQIAGVITAIVFMNTDGDEDRRSFGVALLIAMLVMFVLSCIGCFVFYSIGERYSF